MRQFIWDGILINSNWGVQSSIIFNGEIYTLLYEYYNIMVKIELIGRTTIQPLIYVRHSDPVISVWNGHRLTNKSYSRDNRLMSPERSHRRTRLAPRCRLILSSLSRTSEGFGCSPNKKVHTCLYFTVCWKYLSGLFITGPTLSGVEL